MKTCIFLTFCLVVTVNSGAMQNPFSVSGFKVELENAYDSADIGELKRLIECAEDEVSRLNNDEKIQLIDVLNKHLSEVNSGFKSWFLWCFHQRKDEKLALNSCDNSVCPLTCLGCIAMGFDSCWRTLGYRSLVSGRLCELLNNLRTQVSEDVEDAPVDGVPDTIRPVISDTLLLQLMM